MLELHVGFWSAFLLPLAMFCAGFTVLVGGRKHYIIKPPQGGVIGNAFRALWIAIRNSGDLDRAKPSFTGHRRGPCNLAWDDKFVEELKAALMACKVFLFFPIYWVREAEEIRALNTKLHDSSVLGNQGNDKVEQ
jgi:dipeptide/tripeptide permease